MRRATCRVLDIEPRHWEIEFERWANSPSVPIGSLLFAFEERSWAMGKSWGTEREHFLPTDKIRLRGAHIELLKRRIAAWVYEAGGEYRGVLTWLRSSDGMTFSVHLPGS